LERKVPKLLAAKDCSRTVLVLEVQDIALGSLWAVRGAVSDLFSSTPLTDRPSRIFIADTAGTTWYADELIGETCAVVAHHTIYQARKRVVSQRYDASSRVNPIAGLSEAEGGGSTPNAALCRSEN
jgi:hypothetical protein